MSARLTPTELASHVRAGGRVVDVREPPMFADAHVHGSLNIALSNRSAPYWLHVLTRPGEKLAVVTATPHELALADELIGAAERETIGGLAFDAGAFETAGLSLATMRTITPDELADERETIVVDVRERDEWVGGHVPDAIWIPLAELPARVDEVPPGRVALICASGFRSSIAATVLEAAGRDDLANVWGGTTAWMQLGLPLRQGRER